MSDKVISAYITHWIHMNNEQDATHTTEVIRTSDGSLDVDAYKNKDGIICLDGLDVAVTIVSARLAYGRLDFSITPKFGEGKKWVSSSRVKFADRIQPSLSQARKSREQVVDAPSFRDEVAKRKALHLRNDAERKFTEVKSTLDILLNKKEEQ